MGAALLDPPKVLKGNPGVLVADPGANILANLIAQGAPAAAKKGFWAGYTVSGPLTKEALAEAAAKQPGACPCGCGSVVRLAWATPQALADRKQKALEWVNALRTEWGHPALAELPRGSVANSMNCVIARALPAEVGVRNDLMFADGRPSIPAPSYVREFIGAFDKGYYPELVA